MGDDTKSLIGRLGSWALPPRMHALCWALVSLAFFVWVWGESPEWLRYWLPPMPHTLRTFVALLIAFIATVILSSFISTVLYKGINPSDKNTYFDQSIPKYFFQIVISLAVGCAIYPVVGLFSDWFGWFNYLFALGIGSFIYIAIDSSYIKVAAPKQAGSVRRQDDGNTVIDYRGQLPAEDYQWSGWLKELMESSPEREVKRSQAKDRQRERSAAPGLKYLAQGAIEILINKGMEKLGIKVPVKLKQENLNEWESYEAGTWRDTSLEHNRERVTGAKPKGKRA